MHQYGLLRSSHAWRSLTFLGWRHSGGEKDMGGLCHPQTLGSLTSWWLGLFFLIKNQAGLCYPCLLRMAVTVNLCKFIFILKVPELPRCLDVFELAGELFYFVYPRIQKVFHFEFYHFIWPHQLVCVTGCGIFTRTNDLRERGLFPKAGLWMLVLAPFLGFIKRVFIKLRYLYLPRILVGGRGKKIGLGLKILEG